MNPKDFLFCFFAVISFFSCTKPGVTDDPPVDPPAQPNTGKPQGVLYVNCPGDFVKINANDSTVLWTSTVRNLFASFDNPMTFDSSSFYHGNFSGITAYSSVTGVPRWFFGWPSFDDVEKYQEPAFKESLVFVASPTSVWDHGYLYCLSKRLGSLYWKKELDKGYVDRPFKTTPLVQDDKVIVLTRDAANHRHLTAYKASDGAQQWTTGVNDSLCFRLWLHNGKVYSTAGRMVYCYSADDGSLKWQADLVQNSFYATANFFEASKLIIVKAHGANYYISELNAETGSINKQATLTIPSQFPNDPRFSPLGCSYSNNSLYIASHDKGDSINVRAYNFSDLSLKWNKPFPCFNYGDFTPLLTNKYLIFPINNSYTDGKSMMCFIDLNGNQVASIPTRGRYTAGFVYIENDIVYKQSNRYFGRN